MKNMEWLEQYAQEIENATEEPITFKVGVCHGEYYNGNDEYIPIRGDLFINTHKGNLFTLVDKRQNITDYFDVFNNDDVVYIDEELFKYISTPYKISINQIKRDIQTLREEFLKCSGIWEWEDGDICCTDVAERELSLVKGIAERYPFEYKYDPSDFDDLHDTIAEYSFSTNDFEKTIITEDNYCIADEVASDFKDELIAMLDQLKTEIEWLPPRFRQEFVDLVCECPQDRHSIRKNCEFFTDNIMNELTSSDKELMFI